MRTVVSRLNPTCMTKTEARLTWKSTSYHMCHALDDEPKNRVSLPLSRSRYEESRPLERQKERRRKSEGGKPRGGQDRRVEGSTRTLAPPPAKTSSSGFIPPTCFFFLFLFLCLSLHFHYLLFPQTSPISALQLYVKALSRFLNAFIPLMMDVISRSHGR